MTPDDTTPDAVDADAHAANGEPQLETDGGLVPATSADATPTRPEIDVSKLDRAKRRMYESQCRFLALYEESRHLQLAADGAGVHRETVYAWRTKDLLGFSARFRDAEQRYCERLERIALDRVRQQGPGANPLLLIAMLNAHMPERYRRDAIVADDTARETLAELRRLGRAARRRVRITEIEETVEDASGPGLPPGAPQALRGQAASEPESGSEA